MIECTTSYTDRHALMNQLMVDEDNDGRNGNMDKIMYT